MFMKNCSNTAKLYISKIMELQRRDVLNKKNIQSQQPDVLNQPNTTRYLKKNHDVPMPMSCRLSIVDVCIFVLH